MPREKLVGFHRVGAGAIRQHDRGVVGAQFTEQHVKGDGLGALRGKLLHQPAINVARPVKPVRPPQQAVPESGDAGVVHRDEGEVRGRRRGKILGGADAQVIGDAFEPFGETGIPKAKADGEREDENGQNYRRAFEPLDFHTVGLNKKPAQLKAALVWAK